MSCWGGGGDVWKGCSGAGVGLGRLCSAIHQLAPACGGSVCGTVTFCVWGSWGSLGTKCSVFWEGIGAATATRWHSCTRREFVAGLAFTSRFLGGRVRARAMPARRCTGSCPALLCPVARRLWLVLRHTAWSGLMSLFPIEILEENTADFERGVLIVRTGGATAPACARSAGLGVGP